MITKAKIQLKDHGEGVRLLLELLAYTIGIVRLLEKPYMSWFCSACLLNQSTLLLHIISQII